MKKLLAILAVTTLTVTSGTLLVSCTKGVIRQDKLQYNIDVLKEVLFKITGQEINVNLGDYLTEAEVNEIIQSTLDSTLGLQYAFEGANSNLNNLGVDSKSEEYALYKDATDFNVKNYQKQSNSIAQKKLFKEYTTALSNNESFDFQVLMDGFALGVINEGTKAIEFGTGEEQNIPVNAEIKFMNEDDKEVFWETSVEGKHTSSEIGIPTIETFTKEYTKDSAQFKVKTENGEIGISALTALSLRFQDYFVNKLESDIISNVMVMSHMTSKLFKYKEQEAYINPANLFTSKLQDFNPSNTNWNTNVKMIWTIKYDRDVVANSNDFKLIDNINTANEALSKGEPLNKVVFTEEGKILGVDPILDNTSYDSYFGFSGFQGIKFDTFGDDPTSGKAWADQVNKQQDGPRIIYNDNLQPGFDTDNPNYNEIVVVLPIYFIELMAGSDKSSEPTSTVYKMKDANGKHVKQVKLGRAGSSEEDLWNKWEGFRNLKGSTDVRETLAQENNRENLINELMYMACTDTNFVDAAKRDIYSKYLDKETIYYSGIWDMVKQYIDDVEDEDM